MGRIAGCVLAVLLTPMGIAAGLIDSPTDLSNWITLPPPQVGDDRWNAANADSQHEWVVLLRGDRPSVRPRIDAREKGSPYPERQEAYPPMPFTIQQGSMQEGLSGEWFSVQVTDGWVIGFDKGEWGGALWWFSPDGKKRYKISGDQVSGFFKTDAGLLALSGIAHGTISRGRIIRLTRGGDGFWHSEHFVDLKGAPETAVIGADGALIVATHDRLLRVHLDSGSIDVLLKDAFWGGLDPKSMILAPSGAIYLGMRHGVTQVEKMGAAYRAKWLIPNAEFDRRLPEGFR
ncbi:hypothetical protein SAMN05444166_2077 [Singulisphaera sp. GP187]|uniref:hypothetical protein n=1 Tax=Singulisphaera sp. GP187 TaxID=1882752 RepID=UPI00092A6C50|nr:hypothetical protein [Singulisphaera sp. GP187]SIO02252.1 hypothetical protein SAMN05444166_2077 [Singulisphaera sp. GP187]